MSEYKFTFSKVLSGDTVEGAIHLGMGVSVVARVSLAGIASYSCRLDPAVPDKKERQKQKGQWIKAKKRLKELLLHGSSQLEGLHIKIFSPDEPSALPVIGDIKYIYARDLYNHQPGQKPWVGWKGISQQLLEEGLVESVIL